MRTDEELKLLAQDIKRGRVFTSAHSGLTPETVCHHFMILNLMKHEQLEELEKDNIQVLYEYNDQATGYVGGLPTFLSARMLTRDEWKKVCEFHNSMESLPAKV